MKKRQKQTGMDGRYMPFGLAGRVILVFLILYVSSMSLTTALIEKKFHKDYKDFLTDMSEKIKSSIQSMPENAEEGEEYDRERAAYDMSWILNLYACSEGDPYMLWSAAVWDESGNKIAETDTVYIGMTAGENRRRVIWNLEEYFTAEELTRLAQYNQSSNRGTEKWTEYHNYISGNAAGELASIRVQYGKWRKSDKEEAENWTGPGVSQEETYQDQSIETNYYVCVDIGEAWQWENPEKTPQPEKIPMTGTMMFPGQGMGKWEQWRKSSYLHDFPDHIKDGYRYRSDGSSYREDTEDQVEADLTVPLVLQAADGDGVIRGFTIKFRMVSFSWLAAMDYMKYVYLGSAVLLLVCVIYVIRIMEKSYERSAKAERMRRDFTNAMAHEMKTPLSVIRGFAENLLEAPDTDKKVYYLRQIIGQTEEMDQVVQEMIQVARLDREDMELHKEKIFLKKMLERETKRLAPRLQERSIRMEVQCMEDLIVEGDRKLLEKAFRCLLDNAVSYNNNGGWIRIEADEEKCIIANAGERISGEHLPRVLEMLWSGNRESVPSEQREKHTGMGLYLADRIFCLHEMKLSVENLSDGVQVRVIWKKQEACGTMN